MNDDELLEESGTGHGDTGLAQAFYEWKTLQPKQAIGIPEPSEPLSNDEIESAIADERGFINPLPELLTEAGKHPIATFVNCITPLKAIVADIGTSLGAGKLTDMPSELEDALIPWDGKWDNTIWGKMRTDANNRRITPKERKYINEHADEILKTFEPERP